MEKNYYEILEVDKNASKEIIEKAYKTLIKKYHPDLQENNLKIKYEEKIKIINQAYEVLSNSEKRKNYDLILSENEKSVHNEKYNELYNENLRLRNELNFLKQNSVPYTQHKQHYDNSRNVSTNYTRTTYHYIPRFKPNLKSFISLILTIIVLLILGTILWHIPFTRNYFINLYNENSAFKFLVDMFSNLFT